MLSNLLEIIPKTPDIWYCDTFSMPDFGTLKHWYTGTVILYCWWDPADDRIIPKGMLTRILINFEVRFPIYKLIGGEVFIDGGQLTDNSNSISFNNISYRNFMEFWCN